MPAVPEEGMLLNCRLVFTAIDQGVGMNVLHYKCTGLTGTFPDMNTFNAACGSGVYNHFESLWDNFASQEATFSGVQVTAVFPLPRSITTTYTPATPTVGTLTSGLQQAQGAPTVLKKTNIGQRWARGRAFIYGVADELINNGRLTAGGMTACEAFANLFGSTIGIGGVGWTVTLQPVVLSGPEDNPVRLTPVVAADMSNDVMKSCKRRRAGKGI